MLVEMKRKEEVKCSGGIKGVCLMVAMYSEAFFSSVYLLVGILSY